MMTTTGTAQQLSAPMSSVDTGRLVFTRGAAHLTIGVNGSMDDLYRARFEGRVPDVRTDGGTVTVRYRMSVHPTRGEIELCGGIPWSIRGHMGMSHVVADLEELELTDLEIGRDIPYVEMRLPRPKQTVRIRIGGGASDVELSRPTGVPVQVHIGGGASKLAIDEFRLGSGGGTRLAEPGLRSGRGPIRHRDRRRSQQAHRSNLTHETACRVSWRKHRWIGASGDRLV